jgi:PhnB protein
MSMIPNYVPSSYKTINVMLAVRDAEKALEFYNRAFGAETVMKLVDPNGSVAHAEFKIADTIIMLTEEKESNPGVSSVVLSLYTEDVEGFFETAEAEGARVISPIKKQFYGDRSGKLEDPFGHQWIIATHEEDMTAAELQKRFNDLYP